MSPIEDHWEKLLTQELAQFGVQSAVVGVRSADAENWRFSIRVGGREFEIGFNHTEQLWARETTPAAQKHLISNDQPRVIDSASARSLGLRLVAAALHDPAFPPRDPPVI